MILQCDSPSPSLVFLIFSFLFSGRARSAWPERWNCKWNIQWKCDIEGPLFFWLLHILLCLGRPRRGWSTWQTRDVSGKTSAHCLSCNCQYFTFLHLGLIMSPCFLPGCTESSGRLWYSGRWTPQMTNSIWTWFLLAFTCMDGWNNGKKCNYLNSLKISTYSCFCYSL